MGTIWALFIPNCFEIVECNLFFLYFGNCGDACLQIFILVTQLPICVSWLTVAISSINQLGCMFEEKFVLLILICFQCEPGSTMDAFHIIELGFIG